MYWCSCRLDFARQAFCLPDTENQDYRTRVLVHCSVKVRRSTGRESRGSSRSAVKILKKMLCRRRTVVLVTVLLTSPIGSFALVATPLSGSVGGSSSMVSSALENIQEQVEEHRERRRSIRCAGLEHATLLPRSSSTQTLRFECNALRRAIAQQASNNNEQAQKLYAEMCALPTCAQRPSFLRAPLPACVSFS